MSYQQTTSTIRSIEIPSGRISYTEAGSGPVALFVHGVLLNKHLWRHQLAGLSDIRRCIAIDLLAHGDTEIAPEQDVSVTANEHPETATDEDIEIYLRPHLRSEQRTRDLARFVSAFDHKHTLAIEPQLRNLQSPTLIVWGTDDVYFPAK